MGGLAGDHALGSGADAGTLDGAACAVEPGAGWAIIAALSTLGRLSPKLADKANLARIGRHHVRECMLVLNPATGHYDVDATPEFGTDRLEDHHAAFLKGTVRDDRGAHKVF